MSGTIDWTAVATFVLALVTVLLVGVTVWSRWSEARTRDAVALRAAAYEQFENLRRWQLWEPGRVGQDRVGGLRDAFPSFDEIDHLIRRVALPDDLGLYLIWLVGNTRQAVEYIRVLLDLVAPVGGSAHPVPLSNSNLQDDWELLLDRLQVMLCLLQGEAARRRFRSVGGSAEDSVSWTLPRSGRRALTSVSDAIYLQAPAFPAGTWYAQCSVGARDAAAARIAAEWREKTGGLVGPPVL